MRRLFSVLIVAALVFVMLNFLKTIPEFGSAPVEKRVSKAFIDKSVESEGAEMVYGAEGLEDGCANVVTSIVVNYRSFDTLGEVTVLFTAALGVGILLGGERRRKYGIKPNFVLRIGTGILVPLLVLLGVYIFVHGHLTPGGGFPGGTVIAATILLLYLANEEFRADSRVVKEVEGSAGTLYVITGLLGLAIGGAFLFNFLPTGTVGNLFSSGVVPIVYAIIGLKVGAELSGVIANMHGEEG